jgi:hypothetical protein
MFWGEPMPCMPCGDIMPPMPPGPWPMFWGEPMPSMPGPWHPPLPPWHPPLPAWEGLLLGPPKSAWWLSGIPQPALECWKSACSMASKLILPLREDEVVMLSPMPPPPWPPHWGVPCCCCQCVSLELKFCRRPSPLSPWKLPRPLPCL